MKANRIRVDKSGNSTASAIIVNSSGVSTADVLLSIQDTHPELASMMEWGQNIESRSAGGLAQRDKYTGPAKLFHQFKLAEYATETDNVVSGVEENTEQLAFTDIAIECDDPQQQDVWNQILKDIDLKSRLREIWRELFMYSQCYVGSYWVRKNYSVNTKTENGNKPRKQFNNLFVPDALSIMDVCRIVPVGTFMFGQEDLVYLANSRDEAGQFTNILRNPGFSDPILEQLIAGPYDMSRTDRQEIQRETGATVIEGGVFKMNPARVSRFTLTKPDYKKFAAVRMRSIFELLDMKQLLKEMDRAYLVGATSFIVLIKKGTDLLPAQPGELPNLQAQFSAGTRIPIVVSDHRMEIEIIAPPMDHVLDADKYRLLDAMIATRLYNIFTQGDSKVDDTKLIRVVANALESRRDMMREKIDKDIIQPIYKLNDELTEQPRLILHPRQITMAFDPNLANFLLDSRTLGDLSRYTFLYEALGLKEDDEHDRRVQEQKIDKDFPPVPSPDFQIRPISPVGATTPVPRIAGSTTKAKPPAPGGAAPAPGAPKPPSAPKPPNGTQKSKGRIGGGNANGGGANKQSAKSGPARGPAKAELDDVDLPVDTDDGGSE